MQVSDSPRWSFLTRVLPAALIAVAGAALLLRIPSIAEPLGIDQSLWSSAVRGMARGQLLYRDVWEQRPPGIYLTYLAGFSLLGWTTAVVAWLDVLASAATTVVVYALARALSGPATAALAAGLYATLTMPAWLYGYGGFLERSVCETFIAPCVGLAAWCAVAYARGGSVAAVFGVGLLTGATVVYKPNAAVYLPALLAWIVVAGPADRRRTRGETTLALTAAGLGFALLPAATLIWLWRLDLLADAKTAVFDFNRYYVGQGFDPASYALAFSKAVWLRMKTEPLWLAGGVAALAAVRDLGRTRRLPPLPALAVLWGAAAVLAIVVNGARLFNSYFIQAHAPLALLAAWWLTNGLAGTKFRRLAVVVTLVLMAALLAQRDYVGRVIRSASADAALLGNRLDRTAYLEQFGGYATGRGYSARANEELAAYVRARTERDDRVFLFGINGAGVYFLADRLTAHRFLRVNFFVPDGFPDERFTLSAVVADLHARPPAYLIFERLHSDTEMGRAVDALPDQPLLQSLLGAYALETVIEDFTLYRRR
jgi:hypothetical protein